MVKISSILIGVKDLENARIFYENVFGMKFDEFRPPFASAFLDGIEFNLEEDADYRDSDWTQQYIGGRKNISFQVDDLEKFKKTVKDNGGRIVKDIKEQPWGWREMVIADLDGNEYIFEEEIS